MQKQHPLLLAWILIFFCSCSTTNDTFAITAAEDIVKEVLVSPTTAHFSDERVLDRKKNLFLVQLAVDAQNVYGAMIREYYLVVVELSDKGSFGSNYYKKGIAAQLFDRPTDQRAIEATKAVNGWDNWQDH